MEFLLTFAQKLVTRPDVGKYFVYTWEQMGLDCTPEILDTKNLPFLKGVTFSKAHRFGYVTFPLFVGNWEKHRHGKYTMVNTIITW